MQSIENSSNVVQVMTKAQVRLPDGHLHGPRPTRGSTFLEVHRFPKLTAGVPLSITIRVAIRVVEGIR